MPAAEVLQDARDREKFLDRLEQTAGTRVDVTSRREESRLIHLGVLT